MAEGMKTAACIFVYKSENAHISSSSSYVQCILAKEISPWWRVVGQITKSVGVDNKSITLANNDR